MPDAELYEIQGIVASAYTQYPRSVYVLLRVSDARSARAWVGEQLPRIERGSVGEMLGSRMAPRAASESATLPAGGSLEEGVRVALAFTSSGLQALGLDSESLATFPSEFHQGMTAPARLRGLGDFGSDAPEHWHWGAPDSSVHALFMIHAVNEDVLDWPRRREAWLPEGSGVEIVDAIEATLNKHEPFGFRDGISQPHVEWMRTGLIPRETTWHNTVAIGEFVLGYRNELGQLPVSPWVDAEKYPATPLDPVAASSLPESPADASEGLPVALPRPERRDLGRNGSYMVLRELEQNVEAFKELSHAHAARLIGRWRDGTPLVLSPDREDPELKASNDFTFFATDRNGLKCPIGSHIRRANPRDSLVVPERDIGPEVAMRTVNQHRIIRRGRTYVRSVDGVQVTGSLFACLNANIEQQFEFIQKQWLRNSGFGGLEGERDPLVGTPEGGQSFSVPKLMRRERLSLKKYVRTRGGAYFFLPSISALRFLSDALH